MDLIGATVDDANLDQEVASKKLNDEVMQNRNMNNSLMNSEIKVGEEGESPMIVDDDEDTENMNAIL